MPTIKRKVEMNLPQFIAWAVDNHITGSFYANNRVNAKKIRFEFGRIVSSQGELRSHDTFTVEVEEEITEDTVIPRLVVRHRDTGFTLYENDYINNEFPLDSVQAFYIMNDDLTLTLIWRDGKLVE